MPDLRDLPLATAEFLVVDTETNGRMGDACEVTEIGAVLVGGGELHDRWERLVATRAPLSRGIQRFTGITQEMVDAAPPAETTLPELAEQLAGDASDDVRYYLAFNRDLPPPLLHRRMPLPRLRCPSPTRATPPGCWPPPSWCC